MVKKQRYAFSYGEFENEQKKDIQNFDLPERGFEPQIFNKFSTHDLISMEGEGDKIKSSYILQKVSYPTFEIEM